MKFFTTIFAICLSLVLVAGQRFFPVQRQFNFNPLGGLAQAQPSTVRDPRQNRGPVVFPPSPPADDESSGVIIGASGYGFVPPQQTALGDAYYSTAYQLPSSTYTAYNYFSNPYTSRFSFF